MKKFTSQYSALTLLGTGVIVFHDESLAKRFEDVGYPMYRVFGVTFGFSVFECAL